MEGTSLRQRSSGTEKPWGIGYLNGIEDNTLRHYQVANNTVSLDGLTGLRVARRDKEEIFLMMEVQVTYRRVMAQRKPLMWGMLMGMATMFLFMMAMGG